MIFVFLLKPADNPNERSLADAKVPYECSLLSIYKTQLWWYRQLNSVSMTKMLDILHAVFFYLLKSSETWNCSSSTNDAYVTFMISRHRIVTFVIVIWTGTKVLTDIQLCKWKMHRNFRRQNRGYTVTHIDYNWRRTTPSVSHYIKLTNYAFFIEALKRCKYNSSS